MIELPEGRLDSNRRYYLIDTPKAEALGAAAVKHGLSVYVTPSSAADAEGHSHVFVMGLGDHGSLEEVWVDTFKALNAENPALHPEHDSSKHPMERIFRFEI